MLNKFILLATFILSAIVVVADAFPEPEQVVARKGARDEVEEGVDFMKRLCEHYGNPEVMNNNQNLEGTRSCLTFSVNLYQLLSNMSTSPATVHSHAEEYTAELCSLVNERNLANCNIMLKTMKSCRAPDEYKFNENLIIVELTALKYACNNNGEKLLAFLQDNGAACVVTETNNLLNCANISFLQFQEEECNRIDEVQRCLLGVFAKCKTSLASALEPLAAGLKKVIPCGKTNENDSNTALDTVAPIDAERLEPTTFRHLLDIIDRKLETKNDVLDLFGKYLVASLRKLSNRNSIQAENEVQNILYKYKMQDINDNEWMTAMNITTPT